MENKINIICFILVIICIVLASWIASNLEPARNYTGLTEKKYPDIAIDTTFDPGITDYVNRYNK